MSTQTAERIASPARAARQRRFAPPLGRLIWVAAGVISIGLVVITGMLTWQSRQRIITGARASAENIAQILNQHAVRTIGAVDLVLRVAMSRAAAQLDNMPTDHESALLKETLAEVPYVHRVRVLDGASGATVLHELDAAEDGNERDAELLARHREAPGNGLVIGRPLRDPESGQWLVAMSRRFERKGLPEGAVAIAEVSLDYFQQFYSRVDVGSQGSIVLIRSDGTLLTRHPHAPAMLGRVLNQSVLFTEKLLHSPTGSYEAETPADGLLRIIGYHRVENLPLVIAAGFSKDDLLASWRRDARRDIGIALLTAAIVIGLCALAIRESRRRDRAEASLRHQTALVQATLENMDQGLIMLDANETIQVHNQRVAELLDLPPSLFENNATFQTLLDYQSAHGEFANSDEAFMQWMKSGGLLSGRHSYERTRPNGTVLEVRTVPLPDGGAVRTYTDITSRKMAEVALAEAKSLAEAARLHAERGSQAKSDFLASMSHEIRTPLNGILGFTDLLLQSGDMPPDKQRYSERIRSAGLALLTVVDDILDFSKIEAGHVELDTAPFCLASLIDNSISIVKGIAAGKNLDMSVVLDPELPLWVEGDEARLRQVLLNLLNNAIKFTRKGFVVLTVRGEPGEGPQRRLRFLVSDTGIGIAKEKQERLFQRFSQVDGSIRREFGGTGLGLAISKSLVQLMGGEIGVTSEHGRGSTFWFTAVVNEVPAPELPATLATSAQSLPPRAGRILLVEDLEANQEIAQAVLEAAGHTVDIAKDGFEAIRALRARDYDLVLMDIQMPGMDGITATKRIRDLPGPVRNTPIIAMTANVLPDQVAEFLAAGMNDHIGKPFDRYELLTLLDRWLPDLIVVDTREHAAAAASAAPSPALDRAIYEDLAALMGPNKIEQLLGKLEEQLRLGLLRPSEIGNAALAEQAHTMISQAGMLGFTRLSDICRELETACRGDGDVAGSLLRARSASSRALEDIAALRNRLRNAA